MQQHVGWAKAARELSLMHRAGTAVPTRTGTAKRSQTLSPLLTGGKVFEK
jgi:hypothetical protein